MALDENRYESHANLGTFYLHARDFKNGLKHIDRALAINPHAHFGRERYQRHLVEFIQTRGDSRFMHDHHSDIGSRGFYLFLSDYHRGDANVQAAIEGVLGMMRFGNHQSPILLEALASLLVAPTAGSLHYGDARLLVARALLKASYESTGAEAAHYREQAEAVLERHHDADVATIEPEFHQELAEAAQWFATLQTDEMAWIAAGVDVDAKFAEKYYAEPQLSASGSILDYVFMPRRPEWWLFLSFGSLMVAGILAIVRHIRRHRHKEPTPQVPAPPIVAHEIAT